MDLNNYITFGGISSATYGIYIDGSGTFNSPERDVSLITIPGRNGTLALDNGRFENVEVTYRAFVSEDNGKTMSANIQDFRNAIGALKGYQRLTDTYHTDEYRLGVFRSGLEVNPVIYQTGGEFEIVFDCKPQRFLTSGETATAVANNGTINNPTKFEAQPLLQVWGYGAVTLTDTDGNADTVNIVSAPIGAITFALNETWNQANNPKTYTLDLSLLGTGDTIVISQLSFGRSTISVSGNLGTLTAENSNADFAIDFDPRWVSYGGPGQYGVMLSTQVDVFFVKGTSQTVTNTCTVKENGTTLFTLTQTIVFNGSTTITINQTVSAGATIDGTSTQSFASIKGTSTMSALGSPIYIDLEIGEAYKIVSDEIVGVNNAVILPSILPTLKPGNTKITYPNTVTQFKIVPRWWRL